MDPISIAVTALWAASIATRVAALAAVLYRRLFTRYPVLVLALTVWNIKSAILAVGRIRHGADYYNSHWIIGQSVVIVTHCLLVGGFYVLMARHARRFGLFGTLLIGLFSIISATIATAVAGLLHIPESVVPAVMICTRHYVSICLLTLWLAYGFFRFAEVPLQPNTHVHFRALTILYAGMVVAQQLSAIGGIQKINVASTLAQLVVLGSGIWAHLIWAVELRRDGEISPPPVEITDEEYEDSGRRWQRARRRLREALRDRWRLQLSWF